MTNVEVERAGGISIARPHDDIDAANAEEVRLLLADAVDERCETLVVDLTVVGYLDSAGVDVLFRLAALLADRRTGLLAVIPASAQLRRLAAIVGLDKAIPVHESVQDAIEATERERRESSSSGDEPA